MGDLQEALAWYGERARIIDEADTFSELYDAIVDLGFDSGVWARNAIKGTLHPEDRLCRCGHCRSRREEDGKP